MKKHLFYLIPIFLVLFGFLYWLGIRPENLRKDCYKKADEEKQKMISSETQADMNGLSITKGDSEKLKNKIFNECLLENGLKK